MSKKLSARPFVFLSYAREDVSIAEMLYADLTRAGIRVWLDIYDLVAGQRWESAIAGVMRECTHFLVLVSKNSSSKRGYVQREIRMILDLALEFPESAKSSLVPVFIDRCQPSHPELQRFHWVELYRSYESGLKRILQAIYSNQEGRELSFVASSPSRQLWQTDITEAGWGIIFAPECDSSVRDALNPLIEHRQKAASWRSEELFKVFDGDLGAQSGETGHQFLERFGVGPGPTAVRKVPYYLMLVGSPKQISFSFQSQLAVKHAVGRLWFESPEEYASYAKTVLDAEGGRFKVPERVVFFSPLHADDPGSALACNDFVAPLSKSLEVERLGWKVSVVSGLEARKERLAKFFRMRERPAILFFAGHGAGFSYGGTSQRPKNGALICSEWLGPRWGPAHSDALLTSRDLDLSSGPRGMIAFFCSCFSAGTPMVDEFFGFGPLAAEDFISDLPCKLLGHPKGGALAVVGKVDRLWTTSFQWKSSPQFETYRLFLSDLMAGYPIGFALRSFSARYSELAAYYVDESGKVNFDDKELRTAMLDARNYIILGDPAVKVPV